MAKVLIIDDDESLCNMLGHIVTRMGHEAVYTCTIRDGRKKVASDSYGIVLLDVGLPDGSGLDLLPDIRTMPSRPEVIIITSRGNPDGAELAIKNGAWDYIEKPFSKKDIEFEITRAIEHRELKLKTIFPVALKREGIIGSSLQMKECLDLIAQASCTDAAVLITGETGTGKELFAKAVHENSSSSKKHFVVVDCTAIPETLVESLLFGYKKGAFTGADKDTEGLIKQANGGTLFLDEIGELPPKFQKVFLRVLQERRFRPLGSQDEEESNFRLVAATNRDLEKMAKHGEFRKDLLFRLKSIVMTIPPLRQRGDDTREIVQHYVTKFCDRNSIGVKGFSPDFFEALSSYHWPGNVRELINAMEWTISVALNANVLNPKHLPEDIRIHMARSSIKGSTLHSGEHGKTMRYTKAFPKLHDARESAVLEAEKKYLNDLIQIADGDIKEACQLSGLERTQVYTLLKKHGLSLRN